MDIPQQRLQTDHRLLTTMPATTDFLRFRCDLRNVVRRSIKFCMVVYDGSCARWAASLNVEQLQLPACDTRGLKAVC